MKRIIRATWVIETEDYPGSPDRTQMLANGVAREFQRLVRLVDFTYWGEPIPGTRSVTLKTLSESADMREK